MIIGRKRLLRWFPCFALRSITLPHSRWRRFVPPARTEQTRVSFAELKLLFAIIMPQIGWELPDLLRKWKNYAWSRSLQWFFPSRPSSCGIIKISWLRLWIMGGCEACGTALRLSNCINEPVSGLGSLLYICCSNSESGETNISGTNKTHRSTRTTRGRPVATSV